MLPIFKKLRDRNTPPAGLVVETRSQPQEPSVIEDIQPCAVHILMAISAGDAKALAEAMHEMHEIMHMHMDKDKQPSPHSYESQRE